MLNSSLLSAIEASETMTSILTLRRPVRLFTRAATNPRRNERLHPQLCEQGSNRWYHVRVDIQRLVVEIPGVMAAYLHVDDRAHRGNLGWRKWLAYVFFTFCIHTRISD